MFKIELINIADDGFVGEHNVEVETLIEAEVLAMGYVMTSLHTTNVALIHQQDLIYSVMADNKYVGDIVITSVSKRKVCS